MSNRHIAGTRFGRETLGQCLNIIFRNGRKILIFHPQESIRFSPERGNMGVTVSLMLSLPIIVTAYGRNLSALIACCLSKALGGSPVKNARDGALFIPLLAECNYGHGPPNLGEYPCTFSLLWNCYTSETLLRDAPSIKLLVS